MEAILDMSFRVGDKLDEPHPALPLPAAKNQSPDAETEAEEKLVGGGGSRRRHGEDEGVEADDGDTKGGFEGGFPGHDEVKRRAEEEDEGGGTGAGRWQGEEKLPAARAGEAYGGGEVRRWMFDWKARKARARRGPLNVTMFVSDFHAERMDAVFQWVFGLEPSLLRGKTTVTVSRDGIRSRRRAVVLLGRNKRLFRLGVILAFSWYVFRYVMYAYAM